MAVSTYAHAQTPYALGLDDAWRLDRLAKLRPYLRTASISSYDRTGGNDDGFSGKYSFVRKEGDALVVADLKGPGIIYRIWTPTPTDDPMEFYFDGEETPRIRSTWRAIFTGNQSPFLAPLSSSGAGGFYTYVPLPYRKSCKVVIRAPRVQFYQINYAELPPDSAIESFTQAGFDLQKFESAKRVWSAAGSDISAAALPPSARQQTTSANVTLRPGKVVRIFETRGGGRIAGIRIGPAAALERKQRDLTIRAFWDGDPQPAINAPIGDLFGCAWGQASMRSLVAGISNGAGYLYLPMPFDKSARIELVDERADGPPIELHTEVVHATIPRAKDEARFYALWRRENPTSVGKPFTYVETEGRGHVVGVALQAQGMNPGVTPFFEGDDQCWIDGDLAMHGTGSEDFFNGGWYDVPGRWEGKISFPVSGCLEYNRPMARSGGFRFFLGDAYAFRKSIRLCMEHAPEKNDLSTDYAAITYLYCDQRPTMDLSLPSVAARAVTDPSRLVFTPGWYVPLHSFSIQDATLTKREERIGNQPVRYLSMRATGEDVFGQHHVSLLCSVPAAGRYRVTIEALEGAEEGIVQLYHQERAVGERVDLYAPERKRRRGIVLGDLDMNAGQNQVFIKLVGQNKAAAALGFDLVTVILERVP